MPATVKGTANAVVNAITIAIPTHAVGDMIIIFGYNGTSGAAPGAPAAAGTVPTWTTIDTGTGNLNGQRTAYAIATATNHTSGTWTFTDAVCVVVQGQTASPIGAEADGGSTGLGFATAPAITPTATDGSSLFLHFMGHKAATAFNAWSAAPAGYTQQAAATGAAGTRNGVLLITKDSSTSDGAVTNNNNGSQNNGYRCQTLEVLGIPSAAQGNFFSIIGAM